MSTVSSTSSATVSSSRTSSSVSRSGLTTDEAVSLKVQPYLDRIDTINSKISDNELKISCYESMQDYLTNLQDAVDALRNPVSSTVDDVFEQRSATLTSDDSTVTASSVMSVDVEPGTEVGTHTVVVTQLAQAERLGSTTQSSKSDALGYSGTFSLSEAGKTATSITITSDMSLTDVADAINADKSTTGIKASIITVTDGSYKLVLTAADTGSAITLSTESGTFLSDLGITTSSTDDTPASYLTQAQSAKLTVDGVEITRSSNEISDAIDGVSLDLTATSNDSTITIKIGNDTESAQAAIEDFVSAYNSWRSFVDEMTATDDTSGEASDSAYLFGDSTLRSASLQIDSALTSYISNISLSAIGVTLNEDNQLEIDSDSLETALDDNFDQIASLFTYQATSSSSDLTMTSHGDATFAGTATLDITCDSSGSITGVSVGGDSSLFTVSGTVIKGKSGSIYDGLTFNFTGSKSESVTITATQGIADRMYQICDQYGNDTDGYVQTLIDTLTEQDDSLQSRADSLQDQADNYYDYLLDQYGTLEASISQANFTQSLLETLIAQDSSD